MTVITSRSRSITKAQSTTSFSDDEFANLSSMQTWEVLTTLLYQTVLPLAKTTTFAMDLIFTILTSTADQRRRISIYDSAKCLQIGYNLLSKPPETIIHSIIFEMGVERWVISNFINNFLSGMYKPKMIDTPDSYYFTHGALMRHVRDMYAVYNSFRRRICERFIKLSDSQAAKNQWQKEQFGLTSDLDDNKQNYFLSIARAIDKLYPNEGTLGSYVLQWLANSAGSTFTVYTGEAFNLARPVRKEIHDGKLNINNKAYGLEGAVNIPIPEDNSINAEDITMLSDVMAGVQKIPSMSLTLLLHGFKHIPTPELIDDLQRHMTNVEHMTDVDDYLQIPMPDMEDLPVILPLSRSSRRNTEQQRRRKDALAIRGQK